MCSMLQYHPPKEAVKPQTLTQYTGSDFAGFPYLAPHTMIYFWLTSLLGGCQLITGKYLHTWDGGTEHLLMLSDQSLTQLNQVIH